MMRLRSSLVWLVISVTFWNAGTALRCGLGVTTAFPRPRLLNHPLGMPANKQASARRRVCPVVVKMGLGLSEVTANGMAVGVAGTDPWSGHRVSNEEMKELLDAATAWTPRQPITRQFR